MNDFCVSFRSCICINFDLFGGQWFLTFRILQTVLSCQYVSSVWDSGLLLRFKLSYSPRVKKHKERIVG